MVTLLSPAEGVLASATAPAERLQHLERPLPSDLIPTGATAVVRADGDCLRLRAAPGTAYPIVTCLPEGALVTALDGRVSADGYWWQRVQGVGFAGWAAEMFLRPSAPAPVAAPAACPAAGAPASTTAPASVVGPAAPAPTLTGALPRTAGYGLVVWGGGPIADIAATAAAGGCVLRSVWTTDGDGTFIGYLFGAPAFVNRPWLDRFPGDVPGGTAAIVVCGGPSGTVPATATIVSNITPAPTAAAPVPVRTAPPPAIGATAAVVIDGASGAVLFEKNAHQPLPPASLTKMATAILAVEGGNLDRWVSVDVDSRTMTDSTVMGLRPGDCFRMRDLLYGLLLPSGNDAALAIGRSQAGTDAAFVDSMNALLARLGLRESHFVNAHGLNAPGHVASASDLALLARYGMTMPDFVAAVGARQWSAQGSRTISLANINAFLTRYPGADGVKTGYTEQAGRTLVASVMHNGRRVFVAVLNAPDREGDAQALFDWAFASFVWV
jgi:D-alanyl-D-alanine carboxypeptidase